MRLLLFLLCFWPLSLLADARWQAPAYLQQAFIDIALRNEYTSQGRYLRRWREPVKVWLDHQVPDQELHTGLVAMHLKHLEQLTGHPIRLVSRKKEANLRLVFTRQSRWREQVGQLFGKQALQHVHGAVCMASFRVNGRYEITQAAVIIPVDQARMHGKLVACIVEELTQMMGLPNDSERVYPSIFNDKTPEDLLSGLDGLLLRMLYHPDLWAGMTEQQVQPVLRKLIRQWQEDGTIASAVAEVRRGELYPLLGY